MIVSATLVPPEVLTSILDGIYSDGMQESIPGAELMTYYGFELIQLTVITDSWINVMINIPMHHTTGLHLVYRATLLPQPTEEGSTATQYKLSTFGWSGWSFSFSSGPGPPLQ